MARESALWGWLSNARHHFGAALQMTRIENMIGSGTPDVEGFLQDKPKAERSISTTPWPAPTYSPSGQFWLELKSSERPARPATPVRFKLRDREHQIYFMRRRWQLGGNAFWLLQVGSGSRRRLFLAPGDAGAKLHAGMTEAELAALCCNTGIFSSETRFKPQDVLQRVIICRHRQQRFAI